jgi:hypothetical protein
MFERSQRLSAAASAFGPAVEEAELREFQRQISSFMAFALPLMTGVMAAFLLNFALAQSAWIHAVSEWKVTGGARLVRAYTFASRRMWRLIATLVIVGIGWLVVFTVLAVVVAGAFAFAGPWGMLTLLLLVPVAVSLMAYWSLVPQVAVIERRGPIDSLSRSFRLVSGSWWRVFGTLLLTLLAYAIVGLVIGWPIGFAFGYIPVVGPALAAAATGFVFGLVPIVFTLLYFDLRTRKDGPDGFDTQRLAAEIGIEEAPLPGPFEEDQERTAPAA